MVVCYLLLSDALSAGSGDGVVVALTEGRAVPGVDRPRVLAIAFACDPERGSESAGGWGTVQALAEWADVTVLLHPRHEENVRAWQEAHPDSRAHLRFVYIPTVTWGLRAQRIGAFRRISWLARYQGWLRVAREWAVREHARQPFDVAIHASLGMYWLPSTIVELGIPSVWGPVSGAAPSPRALRSALHRRDVVSETLERWVVTALSATPPVQATWRDADVRMTETEHVRSLMPDDLRTTTFVANRAILSHIRDVPDSEREPFLVFSSPLESRKAPIVALEALARTRDPVRLLFIHKGPEEPRLRRRAEELGIADRVEFRGRVPRDEMWDLISRAAACVFTGLREEGGCALAEAMLAGAPVVVLGHGGARLLAESATDQERIRIVDPTSYDEVLDGIADGMTHFTRNLSRRHGGYLDQEATKQALQDAVRSAMVGRTAPTGLDGAVEDVPVEAVRAS